MKKIIWFRYDLRIYDNQAFINACKSGVVIPIFIFDEKHWKLPTSSSFHLKFLKNSLADLEHELAHYQIFLHKFYGDTEKILKALIDKYKIKEVYSTRVIKNDYLRKLDKNCHELFRCKNIIWREHDQFGIQT